MPSLMRSCAILAALALAVSAPGAQVTSSLQSISLSATKNQSVTLSAPSPAAQSVTLVDGQINQYAAPFTTTVSWDVASSAVTTVKLIVYFPTPAAALTNGGDALASSLIEVSADGATWHALTESAVGGVGTAGGSYALYSSATTSGANRKSSSVITFRVRVNLTGNAGIAAGTYSGTLHLMAICN